MDRYLRELLAIGREAFERVRSTKALIAGCGALGSSLVESLARIGIGKLVLIDADVVEIGNLSTTHMYTTDDVGRPKVDVCRDHVSRINPEVEVEVHHDILDRNNVEDYVSKVDVVFDGLDSLYVRLLLNDACVKLGKPFFYAGISGEYVTVKAIVPGVTSCLSCFLGYSPNETNACNVLGTTIVAPSVVANLQVQLFLNYLRGNVRDELYLIELDRMEFARVQLSKNPKCKACGLREFPYLGGKISPSHCEITRIEGRSENLTVTEGSSFVKICYPEGCFQRRRY
ncbi:MAG: HesA/MoeB/ThiF family protein [Thermoprotei archaeon]